MTRNDDGTTTTTRRGLLAGVAGLLAATAGAGRAGAGADSPAASQPEAEAEAEDDEFHATEHAPGTVDAIHLDTHHEPGLMVVCLDDGRQVCGSPDVYHIGEGDRVTARVRDGRLIGVSLREDETRERREQATDRLETLARD